MLLTFLSTSGLSGEKVSVDLHGSCIGVERGERSEINLGCWSYLHFG